MAQKAKDIYDALHKVEGDHARIQLDISKAIMPLGLGVELPGEYVSEVVRPNIKLPHTTKHLFSTSGSFQMAAEFHIVLGDRPLVRDNLDLCRIRVRNIKWSSGGVPRIDLKFSISADGEIVIGADNLDHKNANIIVHQATTHVSAAEIERLQAESKEHADEDAGMRELIDRMLEDLALIGVTDDRYAFAKRKMGFTAKRAYKDAKKRLNTALHVKLTELTPEKIEELMEAEAAFKEQRQIILPLYKQVKGWYER
jgi:Molecular chaperone